MMLEHEAREHRCCGPEGSGEAKQGYRVCIASRCMGWRWGGYRYTKDYGTDKVGKMVDPRSGDYQRPGGYQNRFPLDHVGFCGLAGPEIGE